MLTFLELKKGANDLKQFPWKAESFFFITLTPVFIDISVIYRQAISLTIVPGKYQYKIPILRNSEIANFST